MSKSRKKTHSEVEHLKGIIKEQKKIIRSLESKLKQLERREHHFEDSAQDTEAATDSEDTYRVLRTSCSDCGKGTFDEFEIMNKTFGTCNICGFRKRLK